MSDEMRELVMEESQDKMRKAIAHLQGDFGGVRTGRASSALVEKLKVEVYGSEVPLQQIAGFGVPEPRVLTISPYDKTSIKAIEKALQGSALGINPSNDGAIIRLVFPELTEERRRELVKVVRNQAEEARVAVRNIRRQTRHELEGFEKDGEVGTDEVERAERGLDKLTAEHTGKVDEMLHHKEADLLQV